MFEPKDYPCKCHVCGREFVVRSEFLSGIDWTLEDGRTVVMVSCNIDPDRPVYHPSEEVRDAYNAWWMRGEA